MEDLFNDNETTYDMITMKDENGNEKEYFVIDGIEDNSINYILVVDVQSYKDESDETEACILKETALEGEEAVYEYVTDDNEYQRIAVLLQENDPEYEMKF